MMMLDHDKAAIRVQICEPAPRCALFLQIPVISVRKWGAESRPTARDSASYSVRYIDRVLWSEAQFEEPCIFCAFCP